jgi:tetratricopeptide (TPR) repeat protein
MREKPKELVLAQQLMEQGDYKEALQTIDNLEEVTDLNVGEKLSYYLLKGSILFNLGHFEDSYKIANQAYQESKGVKDYLYIIDILILIARNLNRLNKFEESFDIVAQAEDVFKNFPQESSNDLKQRMATLFSLRGAINFYKGDSDNALLNIEESFTLREEIGDKRGKMFSLMQLGWIYSVYKGDLEKSKTYSEWAKELGEEIGVKKCRFCYALNLVNLGWIYGEQGELDRSLSYSKQSIEIFKELEDNNYLNMALANIGWLLWLKGENSQASEYFERRYVNVRATGNSLLISIALANMVELSIERDDLESANNYLKELQKLNDAEENVFVGGWNRFCKAMILKKSSRIRDQAKAQEIFKQLVEDKISTDIVNNAFVELCDLLLIELRSSNNLEILNELNSLINQLLEFAQSQNSFRILGETYLLQARLALILFDFKKARQLFSQAQKVVDKYGIKYLAIKISSEHDELLKDLEIWETLKEKKVSITERLRLAHLGKDLDILVKKRAIEIPKMKAEQPILLLILSKSGRIILSNPFIAEMTVDDAYIGKFLTFFNTYTNQIFSESFDRVKFGQYTVLFNTINSFFVVYMFHGQTYGARLKLIHFSETIKKESKIKQNLESSYSKGKIINLSNDPMLEELIMNSFLPDPQKLQAPFNAYVGDKHFVFVSYCHVDKLQVFPIIDFLNNNGIRIWYDEGIPISEDWKKSIADNLEQCKSFLVFISPHIVNSEIVRKEISFAFKKKKQFFAVYLQDMQLPSELEFEIADIQALMKYKLSEAEFYNKLKDSLIQSLVN